MTACRIGAVLTTFPQRESRRQIGHFLWVGSIGFGVDAGVLAALVWLLEFQAEIARVPGFIAAVVTTWLLNRQFTFRTPRAPGLREFATYLSAMSLGLGVNYLVFVLAVWSVALFAQVPVLALVPATLCGMTLNFLTARRILRGSATGTRPPSAGG